MFLVALVVVVAFAIWLAVTGSLQAAAWTTYNVTHHCLDVVATRNNCFALGQNYSTLNNFALVNLGLAVAMPALLGLVLGAPLVAREIEQGTNRLAWTQSITRTRWLLVKLGVGALACCAIVGAMAPLLEWWTGVIHRGARILPSLFDISGFVAVSYVLFAFMLGAVSGRAHPPDRMGLRGGNSSLCARPVRCAGLRSAKSGLTLDRGESRGESRSWWHFISHSRERVDSALRRCAPWSFQSRSWPDLAERLPNGRKLPGRRREPGRCESLYRREQAPLRRPVPADESLLGLARHRERDLHRGAPSCCSGSRWWP